MTPVRPAQRSFLYRCVHASSLPWLVTALVINMGLPVCALAADKAGPSAAPDVATLPSMLQQSVKAGQIKVVKQFATAKPGMVGYVVEQNGQHQVIFNDDGYLLIGELYSPSGNDLTHQYAESNIPKPDVTAVVKSLDKTGHLVTQGREGAPVLYVFADPNCIYCHRFYKAAAPLVKAGRLQLRWALVGFLKPTSMGRAAAILSAKNPADALARNEAGFNESKEEGGMAPVKSPSSDMQALINERYKQMAAAGGNGTPTVLFKAGPNKWAAKVGMPPDGWLDHYAAPAKK